MAQHGDSSADASLTARRCVHQQRTGFIDPLADADRGALTRLDLDAPATQHAQLLPAAHQGRISAAQRCQLRGQLLQYVDEHDGEVKRIAGDIDQRDGSRRHG